MSNPRTKHTGKITRKDGVDGVGAFMRAVWADTREATRGFSYNSPREEIRTARSQDLERIKAMSDAECDQAAAAEYKSEHRRLRAKITRHTNIHRRLMKAEQALSAFNDASGDKDVKNRLSVYKAFMWKYVETRKMWAEDDIKDARHELSELKRETGADWRKRQIDEAEYALSILTCNPTAEEVAEREAALNAEVEKRIVDALKKSALEMK